MIDFDGVSTGFDRPAIVSAANQHGYGAFGVARHVTDILRRTLEVVIVGEAKYRLRNPLTLTFYPYVSEGVGELIPEPDKAGPEEPNITGLGMTYEEALEDWTAKLHVQVQGLLAKRPWEMTPEESKEMASIERMIDIPAYHRETPCKYRQIGSVTRCRPMPDRIRWEDGLVEHVNLHQMPPEFATFLNGQRFEAITSRDPMNGHLLGVVYVGKLDRLKKVPAERWNKVQTFLEAPEVGWDEID